MFPSPSSVVGALIFIFFPYTTLFRSLDMFNNETYTNGMAASIYRQSVPWANAAVPPGEWNTYNIIYEAPEFRENGSVKKPAYITVFWNGGLVQHKTEIQGTTEYIGPRS